MRLCCFQTGSNLPVDRNRRETREVIWHLPSEKVFALQYGIGVRGVQLRAAYPAQMGHSSVARDKNIQLIQD